ncbi:MAG: hypothetical protein NVV59_08935 [Chitinophagaceae bacterium]|nr:hypothetical protein [Chitinophagaceae bacterium]
MRRNLLLKESDGMHQGFYFKNPGEKAIIDEDFYNSVGRDQLIRPYLEKTKSPSPLLASGYRAINPSFEPDEILPVAAPLPRDRDKRSQAISYFTAEEADIVGLDTLIYSYTENQFKPGSCFDPNYKVGFRRYSDDPLLYRKRHHLSQINVLESNGARYVYGIPVYQTLQKEVTFSIEGSPTDRLINYNNGDNSVFNNRNDGYYQREELKRVRALFPTHRYSVARLC